jgi:hypothetical protein
LCRDVAVLAEAFAAIVEQSLLRVRLDRVRSGQNTKFHMGTERARLLCSYRGLETEFGAAEVNGIPKQSHSSPVGMPAVFRGLLLGWHRAVSSGASLAALAGVGRRFAADHGSC